MSGTQMVRDAGLDAVIGMYPAVHRLRTTVVAPWASFGLGDTASRPPHRVLLYGVPGCGSTFIAGRLASELADVASVGAIVIDSVDDTARRDPAELGAILSAPESRDHVLIGVSHRPWELPSELFGDGGFERMTFVPPPDWDARRFRIWESPWGSRLSTSDLDRLVVATEGWAGCDIARLADVGAGLSPDGLLAHIGSTKPMSAEWLEQARVMIRSLDSYGRVDDLVGYLQRYRLL